MTDVEATDICVLRVFGWSLRLVREPVRRAAPAGRQAEPRRTPPGLSPAVATRSESDPCDPYADVYPYAAAAVNVEAERALREVGLRRWW